MKTYKGPITKLEPNQIFVFGSNTEGRHGKGAAKWAKEHAGAIYGQSKGLQGQSYAIVTKDLTNVAHKEGIPTVTRKYICEQIADLYVSATFHPRNEFIVAYSGTGSNLNHFTPDEMANLFIAALVLYRAMKRSIVALIPKNIVFEEEFAKLLIKRAPELKR